MLLPASQGVLPLRTFDKEEVGSNKRVNNPGLCDGISHPTYTFRICLRSNDFSCSKHNKSLPAGKMVDRNLPFIGPLLNAAVVARRAKYISFHLLKFSIISFVENQPNS